MSWWRPFACYILIQYGYRLDCRMNKEDGCRMRVRCDRVGIRWFLFRRSNTHHCTVWTFHTRHARDPPKLSQFDGMICFSFSSETNMARNSRMRSTSHTTSHIKEKDIDGWKTTIVGCQGVVSGDWLSGLANYCVCVYVCVEVSIRIWIPCCVIVRMCQEVKHGSN